MSHPYAVQPAKSSGGGIQNGSLVILTFNTGAFSSQSSDLNTYVPSGTMNVRTSGRFEYYNEHELAILNYIEPQVLAGSGTIAYDVENGVNAISTLTADSTLGPITNAQAGQCGSLRVVQDDTGGWALTLDASQTVVGGAIADVAALAASGEAIISWSTDNGSGFDFWITA